ncbi:MAG: MarR family transcriptional regulator [Candidatus Micrarchaeia archaeon]|jgi:hypothetical protein
MGFSENKALVGVVAILLLLFVAAVFFYSRTLNELAAGSCSEDASACAHAKIVETQNSIIAALVAVIATMAVWLGYNAYFAKPEESKSAPGKPAESTEARRAPARKQRLSADSLDADEARVVAVVNSAGGSVFQSDIMKTTGFSKVKVSRLLDRLEQKGLLERKRRGMTNLVVAK